MPLMLNAHTVSRTLACRNCGLVPEEGEAYKRCSRCRYACYHNDVCQKEDWSRHKKECTLIVKRLKEGASMEEIVMDLELPGLPVMPPMAGTKLAPTGRSVTLDQLWPVLAISAFYATLQAGFPPATALQCQITRVITRPDRSLLVELGKNLATAGGMLPHGTLRQWHPTGKTEVERSRFYRRLQSDRIPLELNLGLLLGLRAHLQKAKMGVTWLGKTIEDYGLVCGKAQIHSEDRLSYRMPHGSILSGQDPDDHAWMYFRAADGEMVYVDVCLFFWQYKKGVAVELYAPLVLPRPLQPAVPGDIFPLQRLAAGSHLTPGLLQPYSVNSYTSFARPGPLLQHVLDHYQRTSQLGGARYEAFIDQVRERRPRGDGVGTQMSLFLVGPQVTQLEALLEAIDKEKLWARFPKEQALACFIDDSPEHLVGA